MNVLPSVASLLLVPAVALAQSVGVTLTAVTPLVAQAGMGGPLWTASFPAGPMPANANLIAPLLPYAGGACVEWFSSASPTSVLVRLNHDFLNFLGYSNYTASLGPHEILIAFTASAPVDVELAITRTTDGTTGGPLPSIQLDYDNDGVVDVPSMPTVGSLQLARTIGPQLLLVRVLFDGALSGSAYMLDELDFVLTPANQLAITPWVAGCRSNTPPPPPYVQPAFAGRGVSLALAQSPGEPSVHVLSLGAQPTLLGTSGSLPCILLPLPEVVLFEPSGVLAFPLPAAVRPATFFAQGVTLRNGELLVTEGTMITAL